METYTNHKRTKTLKPKTGNGNKTKEQRLKRIAHQSRDGTHFIGEIAYDVHKSQTFAYNIMKHYLKTAKDLVRLKMIKEQGLIKHFEHL